MNIKSTSIIPFSALILLILTSCNKDESVAVVEPVVIVVKTEKVFEQKLDAKTGKDSFIKSADGAKNYGSDTVLWTSLSSPTSEEEILIDFDMNAIPTNSEILEAKLSLYFPANLNTQSDISIKRISTDWLENTVVWNTKPNVASNEDLAISFKKTQIVFDNYNDIDVTSIVKKMISDKTNSHGFKITSTTLGSQKIRSSEYVSADNVGYGPKIIIKYKS
jgi:hypothetical protein